MNQKYISLFSIFAAGILLAGCGAKTTASTTIKPTPTSKAVEMPVGERPYVSLTPSADGHTLTLKMENIPQNITQIEYQVLYDAQDNGQTIEKGVGDTIKQISATLSRDLLLGTQSCTAGCKYNYDTGIVGGEITLNFIGSNGQVSTYDSPFTFSSTADIKKTGKISLTTPSFSVTPKSTLSGSQFFVLMENYKGGYSVFSSGTNSLAGDYPQQ